ncbi:MAG: hydroxymethylglutaryl-CoA lyase [Paraglaciecola sp.]|jgi:hydroxymethylglutaryl-CoA lyase
MSKKIIINDVGPRDGLQNQPKVLTTQHRQQLCQALIDAKVPAIEVGAFVSPKAVPAMANTTEVLSGLPKGKAQYSALIPNMRGYQMARDAQVPLMSLVVAASNTMNQKNINMGTEQAMDMCQEVLHQARQDGTQVQAYVATAWGCPFEGHVPAAAVKSLAERLLNAGAKHIVIADTIGAANPLGAEHLCLDLVDTFGSQQLSCHFHDTRAMGLANAYAAVRAGIRKFDSSIAGLGGCPFAPGASGNVATEDLVMMFEQMGFDTGIDMQALLKAADLAIELTGTAKGGKAKSWIEMYYQKLPAVS